MVSMLTNTVYGSSPDQSPLRTSRGGPPEPPPPEAPPLPEQGPVEAPKEGPRKPPLDPPPPSGNQGTQGREKRKFGREKAGGKPSRGVAPKTRPKMREQF